MPQAVRRQKILEAHERCDESVHSIRFHGDRNVQKQWYAGHANRQHPLQAQSILPPPNPQPESVYRRRT